MGTNEVTKEKKGGLWLGVAIVWALSIGLYFLLKYLEPILTAKGNQFVDYVTWASGAISDPWYKILWAIGDFTEATVHKSILASIGLILFGFIAYWINKKHPEKKLYGISCETGNYPWVILAATSGLLVSSFCYSFLIEGQAALWVPTFLPGCTIPAALVIMYGGGWRVSLTGGILCGLIEFPCAYAALLLSQICGVPSLVFVTVMGMSIGGIIVVEIFRVLPWTRPIVTGKIAPSVPGCGSNKNYPMPEPTVGWIFRRTITDPTEILFFGSGIAGVGLVVGGLLSWALCTTHNSYGVPYLFITMLCAQFMGTALGSAVFYKQWKEQLFYPTYVITICVGVLLLTFGTSIPVAILSVILSVFIIPPCAGFAMNFATKHMSRYPAMVGSVTGMGFGLAVCVFIFKGLFAAGILA